MGAEIDLDHGYIDAKATRLTGTRFVFDVVTVTGTENLMMAATLADGHDGARERGARARSRRPRATASIAMGAQHRRRGHRPHRHRRRRAPARRPHAIMPDRIETGTFLAAAAATGGDVALAGARPDTLDAVIDKLAEAGAAIDDRRRPRSASCAQRRSSKSVTLRTAPYPGFPDRHAGAADGADDRRRRHRRHHRDDLREPHDARAGAEASRRRHRGRGQHRDRQGRRAS